MKNFYLTLISLFFFTNAFQQEFHIEVGPPIEHEGIDNVVFKEMYGGSYYSVEPTKRAIVLGNVNGHNYVIKQNQNKRALMIFNEKLGFVDGVLLHNVNSIDKSEYLGSVLIKDKMYVFYGGKNDEVESGNIGLFIWEFDTKSFKFSAPRLLTQIPDTKKVGSFQMTVSNNKKYISFLIDYKMKPKEFSSKMLLIDHELNIIKQTEKTIEVESSSNFLRSSVSNEGHVIVLLNDDRLYATTRNPFQHPHDHGYVFIFDHDLNEKVEKIEMEGRNLLHMNLFEDSTSVDLFVSWFEVDENKNTGFSKYSLDTFDEEKIYQFDPNWFEAFIDQKNSMQQGGNIAVDEGISKNRAKKQKNVFYQVDHIEYGDNGEITYVIRKNTPYLVPGTKPSSHGNFQKSYGSSYQKSYASSYSGDLVFLTFDKTGKLIKKAKVDRFMKFIFFNDAIYVRKGDKLHVLYYDQLPKGEFKLRMGFNYYYNFVLYHAIYDLKTYELESKIELKNDPKGDFHQFFYMSGVYKFEDGYTGMSVSQNSENMIRLKLAE